jgi:radical SAM-linked protein
LRVGSITRGVLKEIKSVRKTGFTVAPEAGTKRLRDVINKDFTEKEYKETLEKLFTEGWRKVKLYFMIGLPTETQTDIDGIIKMVDTALRMGGEITGRRVKINIGISAFVPKPHTPFQWLGQAQFTDLRAKQDYLRKAFNKKGGSFKGQHIELSLLEAVLSRGDTDCSILLERAWRSGCRFDGWSECFNFQKWLVAAEETGIDLYAYASRNIHLEAELPWKFIDTGITEGFLKSEYHNSLAGVTTSDCRNTCHACGLDCKDISNNSTSNVLKEDSEYRAQAASGGRFKPVTNVSKTISGQTQILRINFSKTGELRYLSHQEVMKAFLRAMNRAELPLKYSAGFHPHPKISFGPALPTGIEGLNEYFDMEISSLMDLSILSAKLNAELPDGLKILYVASTSGNERSLNDLISCYEHEIPVSIAEIRLTRSFMDLGHCHVLRDKRKIDIRPMVKKADIFNSTLRLTLTDSDSTKVRLYEILQKIFQKTKEEIQTMHIKRTRLYGYNNNKLVEPLDRERVWQVK